VRQNLRATSVLMGMAFRADTRLAVFVVSLAVVAALSAAIGPLWLKLLADAALAGDVRGALIVAAVAATLGTASNFAWWLRFNATQALQERTNLLINGRLAELSLGVPGMEHHERPNYQNEMALLREQLGLLGTSLHAMLWCLQLGAYLVTMLVLLSYVHPLLTLLPLFGLALPWGHRKAESIRQRAMEATAEESRKLDHLFDLATDAGPAKELHVFGLRGEFLERHRRLSKAVNRTRRAAELRAAAIGASGWILAALGYAGAIGFVIRLALQGAVTPGDVLMALALSGQVFGFMGGGAEVFSWFLSALRVVRRYLWLSDYAEEASTAPQDPRPVPDRLEHGIELQSVSFRYPGTEKNVLSGVDLSIPAGSTVAIIGENGAGKTTLVKLLCRFYEPTEGSILVDGVDLRRFDVEEWRSRVSAAFQDFARLELLARETVGVGDLPEVESVPAVQGALARAGAEDLPAALPSGLETQLGKDWEGGTELSGGQWQKLALGRAMMREAPLVLILDEPTASLDAQTEHVLFERYAQAAKSPANGKITVLVSHRFSTVRMADLILVVDGGRIREAGSHDELMASGDLYADLYSIQARAYR
jgi:ATP-binding cassette subfamily B protein